MSKTIEARRINEAALGAHVRRILSGRGDAQNKASLLDRLGAAGGEGVRQHLVCTLVAQIGTLEAGTEKLRETYLKLKQVVERHMSPPLYPARFLATVPTTVGELASVIQDGTVRLVQLTADLDSGALVPGEEVYLGHERNVVVAKALEKAPRIGESAAVVRRTEDGRVVISERDCEIVVRAAGEVEEAGLKAGDLVLWDREAMMILEKLQPDEETAEAVFDEIGEVPPQRLGGHDAVRDRIIDRFVYSINHPEVAREYGIRDTDRRLLLTGPPGCGKTTLMRAIAFMFSTATGKKCRVITIAGAELHSPWVGQTEQKIRRQFQILADYDGPGVLFLDEIDSIGRARGSVSGFHDDRFLGTLLAELEGMKQRRNVVVIAATNRPGELDSALRGRFTCEFEIPRPRLAAAHEIFEIHLPEDLPYRPNSAAAPSTRQHLIESALARFYDPNADNAIAEIRFRDGRNRMVTARELVSGRLIEQVCVAACEAAFERVCRGGEPGVCADDMEPALEQAVGRLRATLTVRNVANYLSDLPQDIDVVAVEPVQHRVHRSEYLH